MAGFAGTVKRKHSSPCPLSLGPQRRARDDAPDRFELREEAEVVPGEVAGVGFVSVPLVGVVPIRGALRAATRADTTSGD